MNLIDWISKSWRRVIAVRDRLAMDPMPQAVPAVPAEWLAFHTYLERRYAATVVLTFAEMETLLGRPLPAAARTETGWWTDAAFRVGRCSDAWAMARRTARPNLSARTVAFERLP